MKRWPTVLLPEVAFFQEGPGVRKWQFRSAGIKLINVGNIVQGQLDLSKTDRHLDKEEVEKTYSHFLLNAGDLVMATSGATWGKVAFVEPHHLPLCLNTSVVRFRPLTPKTLNPKYLRAFFETPEFRGQIDQIITGSAQPNFGSSHLKQIRLPLPPLAEQERIVKLLDEANELRMFRTEADRHTATLIPALFHEMFGDPATNPKGWPRKRLGETVLINPKLPREKLPAPEKEFSFVPMAAVDEVLGVIFSTETRRYSEVSKGYTPFTNGDVLFAKITPCMQNGKSAIAENLVGGFGFGSTEFHVLRPTDVVTSEYIFWLIRRPTFRVQAERHFTGSAGQQRVPTSFLENYPCPIPPLALQKEFAQRVTKIRELEADQATSRTRLDALFQSMLHRAFNGNL